MTTGKGLRSQSLDEGGLRSPTRKLWEPLFWVLWNLVEEALTSRETNTAQQENVDTGDTRG